MIFGRAQSFEPPECFEIMPQQKNNEGDMINKGVKGSGKQAVPAELREKIWAYVRQTMAGTSFPVERYCGAA